MLTHDTRPRRKSRVALKAEVRPEIQALRAVAVALVVFYHLWPSNLTGGFVGVDVFLVISGFLITAHLVRGFAVTGKLTLASFYVKRIRRLLPASLLVLGVVALAIVAVVPQTLWGPVGWQLLASAFYFQNWALAAEAVDYLALGSNPSPVQHYWSLSVEEQFYLLWPLLILGLVWAARRREALKVGRYLLLGVTLITAASLAYSVYITSEDSAAAYFITPARVWEFGVGAILAIALPSMSGLLRFRAALSWFGLAAIVGSAVFYSGATPFPGSAALLPTLGAAAIIAAGASSSRVAPTKFYALRPVQFLGDISYSLYLWHWPLIVLLPTFVYGPGGSLNGGLRVAIVLLSVLLAWATKVWVEDRFRHGRPESPRRRGSRLRVGGVRTVIVTLLVSMFIVGGAGGAIAWVSSEKSEAAWTELSAVQAAHPECFGAAASLTECTPTVAGIYPAPIIAGQDADLKCQQRFTRTEPIVCRFGSTDPDALKVALVGDSHANQWLPALQLVAEQRGWTLSTYLKSGCAFNTVTKLSQSCTDWNKDVTQMLAAGEYDLVVTANSSTTSFSGGLQGAVSGFAEAWHPVISSGARVVAIADVPRPARAGLQHPPSCVEAQPLAECTFNIKKAVADDPKDDAASATQGASYVDLNAAICPNETCTPIVGSVLVYRDNNHITATWAKSLAPFLSERLNFALSH